MRTIKTTIVEPVIDERTERAVRLAMGKHLKTLHYFAERAIFGPEPLRVEPVKPLSGMIRMDVP